MSFDELFLVEEEKPSPKKKEIKSTSTATPTSESETIRRKPSTSKTDPHKLNRENMIRFVTAKDKMKKVEANWFFLPTPALEVSNLIDKLLKEGVFKRVKNGWIVVAKK